MVTSFEDAKNKFTELQNGIVSFLTYWVNTYCNGEYIHKLKRINIPIYNDFFDELTFYNFHGLKVVNGTLFVGITEIGYEDDEIIWCEIEENYGTNVYTIGALYNIIDVLYIAEECVNFLKKN